MKRIYSSPVVEKIIFNYKDSITASTPNYGGVQNNNNNSKQCNWQVSGCISPKFYAVDGCAP